MATGPLLHMKRFSCAKFRRYINKELTAAAEINVWQAWPGEIALIGPLAIDRTDPCFLPSRLGRPPATPPLAQPQRAPGRCLCPCPGAPSGWDGGGCRGWERGWDLLGRLQPLCKPLLLRDTTPLLRACLCHCWWGKQPFAV